MRSRSINIFLNVQTEPSCLSGIIRRNRFKFNWAKIYKQRIKIELKDVEYETRKSLFNLYSRGYYDIAYFCRCIYIFVTHRSLAQWICSMDDNSKKRQWYRVHDLGITRNNAHTKNTTDVIYLNSNNVLRNDFFYIG